MKVSLLLLPIVGRWALAFDDLRMKLISYEPRGIAIK